MRPSAAFPTDTGWLSQEMGRLLDFGRDFPHPRGGAAWLRTDGTPDLDAPVYTWITARMTHVYSLAHLLGVPGAGPLADAGLAGLTGFLHDRRHGGWHPAVSSNGPAPGKSCYDHAFVVLAASSATLAQRPGARDLLAGALDTILERFWDDEHEMFADQWDTEWRRLDDYRGLNANMHAVEAMLAAFDATGRQDCLDRALAVTRRTVGWGRQHGWRLPEHFDAHWLPRLDYHREQPHDPFKPYGATVGHALEWSRLILHLEATLGPAAKDWMLTAAAALHARTGEQAYATWYQTWCDYVREHFVDPEHGSWWHELDSDNRPASSTWSGKPDLYHAVQAMLIPRAPLTPGLAAACAMTGAVR